MTSKVSIISEAVVKLGGKPVSSLDEDRKPVTVLVNLFDSTYEAALTMHRWRFAMAKRDLARLSATPLNEWQYAFQLPTDPPYLLAIRTYPSIDYEIFEDKLYANSTTCALDYVFRPAISALPAYFAKTLSLMLAVEGAIPVTGKQTYRDAFVQELHGAPGAPGLLPRSMAADASARPPDAIEDSPFIQARGGY